MLWLWRSLASGSAELSIGGEGRADVVVQTKKQIKRRPAWRGSLPVAGHHLPRFHASGFATFAPINSGSALAGQLAVGSAIIEPTLTGSARAWLLAHGGSEIDSKQDGLLDVMPEELLLLLAA